MTNEKDFHRVILRKVGVYFEARTDDLCILGTDREKLLTLVDLWEDAKRSNHHPKKSTPKNHLADDPGIPPKRKAQSKSKSKK